MPVKVPADHLADPQSFLNDQFFLAALRLASPSFYAILESQQFKGDALNEKAATTLR